MAEIVVHSATDIPFYQGPHEIEGIRFHHARQVLGVTAWGMNVIAIDAGATGYPTHDHRADGQEEVYVVLSGSATLLAGEASHPMKAGDLVRIPPDVQRGFRTDEGVVLLAIGGTPGAVYTPNPGM